MIRFRDECPTHGRKAALQRHVDWLMSEPIAQGTTIPFYQEAKEFCESYLQHKLLYLDSLERRGKHTETHLKH